MSSIIETIVDLETGDLLIYLKFPTKKKKNVTFLVQSYRQNNIVVDLLFVDELIICV